MFIDGLIVVCYAIDGESLSEEMQIGLLLLHMMTIVTLITLYILLKKRILKNSFTNIY